MKNEYLALNARIKSATSDIKNVIKRINYLFKKFNEPDDDGYLDGVFLNLLGFYSGVERIFKDIALSHEKDLPETKEWHVDLLIQMSAEIPTIRPQVISRETKNYLDDYRGFRHLIRNIYTFNIRPSMLLDLSKRIDTCFNLLKKDLMERSNFLESMT